MNPKTTAVLGLAGAAAGGVLRFLDFYLYYDAETGFLANNGMLSIIGLSLMGLIFLVLLVSAIKNRADCTTYTPSKSWLRGICALAAAGGAFFAAWSMWVSYTAQRMQGIEEFSTTGLSMRVPFMIATFVLALYLVFLAVVHFFGAEALFLKAKVLELIPPVWGLLLILYTFIHYSVSVLLPENIFVIFSACALTYALMNKAKYIAGVDDRGLGLSRTSVSAALAFMLYGAYFFSDAGMLAADSIFAGGLPFPVQTAAVLMAMNLMVFLLTAKWTARPAAVKEERAGRRFR